jgi:hypothetical protein
MKNRHFIRMLLTGLVIMIPLGFVLAKVGAPWRSSHASLPAAAPAPSSARRPAVNPPLATPPPPLLEQEDKRPLKERAREAGHGLKLERLPKKADEFADLAALNANSRAVIIGTPVDNTMNLTPDGLSVTIDYKMRVEYVYKGDFKEGGFITVSVPGGMVRFPDGSSAEVKTPWFRKMQQGLTYALFLKPGPRTGGYTPTGEAQGVFEIPTTEGDRVVKTYSGLRQDRIHKYHDMDVKRFLQELRKVTGKKLE